MVGAALIAAFVLTGMLFVRSARFQVWWTLRRVRFRTDLTVPERWLRDWGVVEPLKWDQAADRLTALGEDAVLPLVQAREDENVQRAAHSALMRMGRRAVPRLIEALKNEKPLVRFFAAEVLGDIGPAAKDAAPAITELMSDQNWGVRVQAARALGKIGPAGKGAVPALGRALGDTRWEVRQTAAFALGVIGPAAKRTVPAIARLLTDEEENVRRTAALALGLIGPPAKDAVPALRKALGDGNDGVRCYAAAALGCIGAAANDAAPALKKLAQNDEDEDVRKAAAEALKKIQPEQDEE